MTELQSFKSNADYFHHSSAHLIRPRLRKLLENAMNYPMIVVCAGAGYGKTNETYSFLREYRAITTWLQLSEQDNAVPRFWKNFVNMVSNIWPESKQRLLQIGFPKNDEAFFEYVAQYNSVISPPMKFVLVFDDVHLLRNPDVLFFLEKLAGSLPPDGHVMLLSRTIPDINLTGMMRNERIFIIREEYLCFLEDEVEKYFNQLEILITRQEIRDIYEATGGWPFAVNLIGRSLIKNIQYNRYMLEVMKENIFRLIDTEISRNISGQLYRFLLRIALVDNHAAGFLKTMTGDGDLIKEMEQLNAYIRYDFYIGTYKIQHFLLEYLRQNQNLLTDGEKRETYKKAGEWCENDNCTTDALKYYEKAGDYDAVLRIIYSFSIQAPLDLAGFASEILDRIPMEAVSGNPIYPAMKLKMIMSLGRLDEASSLAREFVGEYVARPESPEKNRALSEIYCVWAYLRMIMSTYTGVYDFDAYFKKQRIYYDESPYATNCASALTPEWAYALLIGVDCKRGGGGLGAGAPEAAEAAGAIGAAEAAEVMVAVKAIEAAEVAEAAEAAEVMVVAEAIEATGAVEAAEAIEATRAAEAPDAAEEYIKALARSIPHASHVLKGNMYGFDDLAHGELYFYRQDLDRAEQYLMQAKDKAYSKEQYSTYNRALLYLMYVTFFRGDVNAAINTLRQIKELLNVKEYPFRYEAYDIACSQYYLAVCQPEQISDWLKTGFSPYAHPAFFENYANLIKAQYRYLTRRYIEVLAFHETAGGRQKILLGRVKLEVLKALSLYRLKRKDEAIAALTEAYKLAEPYKIVTLFTYFAKDMRTLSAAALKDDKCQIPGAWLENINRKSSAFAKRQSRMVSHYKATNGVNDEITLTKREAEVLIELSQGLSRTEIAAIQNISINTVKMVINIIYEKLSVTSLPEAIRAAIERKII